MVSELFFYQLALIALLWLCLMLHGVWPSDRPTVPSPLPQPRLPRRQRRCEPTPFAGLTTKPHCGACAHASDSRPHAPSAPPPRLVPMRGRRRQVDTSHHFCPNPDCAYRGWGAGAISVPMAIPMGAPGGNCCASPVTAIFSRPSGRSSTVSASPRS